MRAVDAGPLQQGGGHGHRPRLLQQEPLRPICDDHHRAPHHDHDAGVDHHHHHRPHHDHDAADHHHHHLHHDYDGTDHVHHHDLHHDHDAADHDHHDLHHDYDGTDHVHHHDLRSEEHTSELQSRGHLVCRLLLEKKKQGQSKKTPASPPNHQSQNTQSL